MDTHATETAVTTESQQQPTTETQSTATTTATPTQETKVGQATTPSEGASSEPAYQPNYKYKAAGKELEFDEWVRPVVKSKEQEERLRELYAKANGLDLVSASREKIAQNYEQVSQQYGQLHNEVSEVMSYAKEGDWDSFFKSLKINEQDIINHFVRKHEFSQLPPEQQKIYNERNQFKYQQREVQNQYSQLENNYRNMEVRVLGFELNSALQNQDAVEVSKNYDAQYGEGAFKEFVRDMALARFHQTGQDPTAEEAVKYAVQRIGNIYRQQTNVGQPQQSTVEKPLPVIPRVGGANMSPTRKQPRSLDDLRKMAQEMA